MWHTCADLHWGTILAGAGVVLCCYQHCEEHTTLEVVKDKGCYHGVKSGICIAVLLREQEVGDSWPRTGVPCDGDVIGATLSNSGQVGRRADSWWKEQL